MKIAVGSMGTSLDAWVGGRFGWCPQFILVEPETMDYVVISMPPTESEKEASLQALRAVVKNDAEVVIVAEARPECRSTMTTLGVQVIEGVRGLTARQAVERYRRNKLERPEDRVGEPLRVAVASLGDNLDAPLGSDFGRCSSFVLVEPRSMGYEVVQVEPASPEQEINLAAIRAVARRGAAVVITPHITPSCCWALQSLGIEVLTGSTDLTVRQAIEGYRRRELLAAA
jgi:predicted Fe-Mo cluster-binding NifX family protein